MARTLTNMRVIDDMANQERRKALLRSPDENIALCLRLGRRAVEVYASANGIDLATARRELRALGQAGRAPCSFLDEELAWVASRRS